MPINNWNFFRSVSACNDQKSWLSENPQVTIVIFRVLIKVKTVLIKAMMVMMVMIS